MGAASLNPDPRARQDGNVDAAAVRRSDGQRPLLVVDRRDLSADDRGVTQLERPHPEAVNAVVFSDRLGAGESVAVVDDSGARC
jgi:hypothetical protein